MGKKTKLKEQELTLQEWNDALRVPTPHKNKKKYTRREKHKKGWKSEEQFVYLRCSRVRAFKNKGYDKERIKKTTNKSSY